MLKICVTCSHWIKCSTNWSDEWGSCALRQKWSVQWLSDQVKYCHTCNRWENKEMVITRMENGSLLWAIERALCGETVYNSGEHELRPNRVNPDILTCSGMGFIISLPKSFWYIEESNAGFGLDNLGPL